MKALIAERRLELREHCALDELEVYHRGELADDRQQAIADHLAVCENCTILLLYGVIGADGGDESDPAPADIDKAWERLRPHLENGSRQGRSLAAHLAQGRMPFEQAVPLAVEISRALKVLHSSGRILHSLRAEDVLISPSGPVQLLDRGIAATPGAFEIGYGRPAEDAVIDLFRSLSPEQIAGEELDQRSNLFSLGVLLYELFTGFSPFRDSTPLGTASRILSLEPAPAIELNAAIEPAFSRLIERLLAKEPEDRPPSAAAVVRELETLSGRESTDPWELEEQIEHAYDEIIGLVNEQPAADEEIERSYARLLELQRTAAERFRSQFEASLGMPIDAGEKLLARLRVLREELEDLASSDSPAQDADRSSASAKAR